LLTRPTYNGGGSRYHGSRGRRVGLLGCDGNYVTLSGLLGRYRLHVRNLYGRQLLLFAPDQAEARQHDKNRNREYN
jgi:hypothetical protein